MDCCWPGVRNGAAVCVQVDCVPTGERLVLEDRRRKWPLRAARPQSALRPGCQTQARTAARAPWTRSPDDLTTGRPCSVQRRRCPQADPAGAPAPEALTGLALGPPLLRAAAPQSGLEARVSRLSLLPTLNVRQSILERKSKDRRARGAKHVPVPIRRTEVPTAKRHTEQGPAAGRPRGDRESSPPTLRSSFSFIPRPVLSRWDWV